MRLVRLGDEVADAVERHVDAVIQDLGAGRVSGDAQGRLGKALEDAKGGECWDWSSAEDVAWDGR